MASNKPRLYVALYLREGSTTMPGLEDKYHWGFMTGPKKENKNSMGRRIHATNSMAQNPGNNNNWESFWRVEDRPISMLPSAMLLIRIVVGKIKDEAKLRELIKSVPVRPNKPGWNCVEWVIEALNKVWADGAALGTTVRGGWPEVRDRAMTYVETKMAAHRFDGHDGVKRDLEAPPATWDALTGKEQNP